MRGSRKRVLSRGMSRERWVDDICGGFLVKISRSLVYCSAFPVCAHTEVIRNSWNLSVLRYVSHEGLKGRSCRVFSVCCC
jgi:hypothetical protein